MSLVLEGTLSDVGLCDLLRLIAREDRSGTLRVTIDGVLWSFALRAGSLTSVECDAGDGALDVETTILSLARYRRGAFRLEPPGEGAEDAADEGEGISADTLAGDGDAELARLDERMERAGGEDSHPERDRFPKPDQLESLDPEARAMFALVNGERSLGELVVRSRLDPARALDALEALVEESLVKVSAGPAAPPAPGKPAPGPRVSSDAWRDWVAAAVPLLMLLAWMGLAGGPSGAEARDPFEIRHDPLAAARAAHETERLRAAVEAFRFSEGRLPEQLATLVQQGFLPQSALTDSRGRPYYYARRDGEFVLLAPER